MLLMQEMNQNKDTEGLLVLWSVFFNTMQMVSVIAFYH